MVARKNDPAPGGLFAWMAGERAQRAGDTQVPEPAAPPPLPEALSSAPKTSAARPAGGTESRSTTAERRAAPRQAVVDFVWICLLPDQRSPSPSEGPGAIDTLGHSLNVSASGIGVVATRPVPIDGMVLMEIPLPGGKISAAGRVMRARSVGHEHHELGIAFVAMPPNDRVLLRRYLQQTSERGES